MKLAAATTVATVATSLALLLATGLGTAIAQDAAAGPPPRNADAWCESAPHHILVRDTDKVWHKVQDDQLRDDPEGTLEEIWSGDLDGDGRRDFIARHNTGCGTRECPHDAYVLCRDGTYAPVLDSEYASHIRVKKSRAWQLLELESVGELDSKGHHPRHWSPSRMTSLGYR